jgi:hypothetical protein
MRLDGGIIMCLADTIQVVQIKSNRTCSYSTLRLYFLLKASLNAQEIEAHTEFRQPFIRKWYIE